MPASKQSKRSSVKQPSKAQLKQLHQKYINLEKESQIRVQQRAKAFKTRMKNFYYGYKRRPGARAVKLTKKDFSLVALRNGDLTFAEKKQLYSRFRKIANQNLKALAEAGFSDSEIYTDYAGSFITLSEIGKNEDELNKKLSSVVRFLNLTFRDVAWQNQRKKSNIYSVQKMRYGYWISRGKDMFPNVEDETTYWTYYKFMSEIRRRLANQQFDSEAATVLYNELVRRAIPFSQLFPETDNVRDNQTAASRLTLLLQMETTNDTISSRIDRLIQTGEIFTRADAMEFSKMFGDEV